MHFSNKKGFTFIELVVVIFMISSSIVGIVLVAHYSFRYVEKTQLEVQAINLAREGMEMVFQMRNTNRRRRSGKKDFCWLKIDPLVDVGNQGCEDDPWFGSGIYRLDLVQREQQFYVVATLPHDQGNDFLSFGLCYIDGGRKSCQGNHQYSGDYFVRKIVGKGLFLKDTTNSHHLIDCQHGNARDNGVECGSSQAKEFRFCSVVEYYGNYYGSVELCSVITNFEK